MTRNATLQGALKLILQELAFYPFQVFRVFAAKSYFASGTDLFAVIILTDLLILGILWKICFKELATSIQNVCFLFKPIY